MTPDPPRQNLLRQVGLLLRLAGSHPRRWAVSIIAVSLALAALDMLGVAAMLPLTQLISGSELATGVRPFLISIFGTTSTNQLIPAVAISIAALFTVKSIVALGSRWWLLGRTTRVSAEVSAELLRRYVLSPYADHRSRQLSETYRNVETSTVQATSVLLAIVDLCTDAVVLIAITIVLVLTTPLVALVTIAVFVVLMAGLQRALRHTQAKIGEEVSQAALHAWRYLLSALDGFREARLSASGQRFVDEFRTAKLRGARAGRMMGIVADLPRYALEICFVLAVLAISLTLLRSSPEQALAVLGIFGAASLRALPALTRMSANIAIVRTGRVGLDVLGAAIDDLGAGTEHTESHRSDDVLAGDIMLRNLSFSYADSDQPVVDDVTLTIPENRTTAFVGSSGAGKSTLVDLILGLLTPSSGTITCGGTEIDHDLAAWYAGLGVVPQDVFLLNDTIAANVAFGVPSTEIDSRRVSDALERARLSDVVDGLPRGLDTRVGERGVRLSGGQRQRLGLARALYREPRILVLDEATSALDNETEYEIAATLAQLQGHMTILVVAHRLSTVRGADTIVFLQDGTVTAQGTFDELRATNSPFARLVELGDLS